MFQPEPDDPHHILLDVGHDLDGCWYDFAAGYYEACCELGHLERRDFMKSTGVSFQPATRWEFYEDYGHSLRRFITNCHEAADMGLLWAGPAMPGSKEAWRTIHKAGHRIHVKTDRAFGTHPLASEVATRMWLAREALRYESITFGPDKTAGPHVDIMVEDKLENYDRLVACTTTQVWLLDRPWNQDPGDTRRRVYSLDEFVTRVNVLQRQKQREAIMAAAS